MGLIVASCFFLCVIALLVMHHETAFIPIKNCTICKAKTFLTGTPGKVKHDAPHLVIHIKQASEEIYLRTSWIGYTHQKHFIVSTLLNPYLNKAPPSLA